MKLACRDAAGLGEPPTLDPLLRTAHKALRERRLRLTRLYATTDSALSQLSSAEQSILESRALLECLTRSGKRGPASLW
jgi:hypothetical protein